MMWGVGLGSWPGMSGYCCWRQRWECPTDLPQSQHGHVTVSCVTSLAVGARLERPFLRTAVEGDRKGAGKEQKARACEGDSGNSIQIPQL